MQSFNKLLDLDLAIIQDAYDAEYLTREKVAEHERSEVKFRMLVEAAACMVVILRDDDTIAYFSPYSEELTGYLETEVMGGTFCRCSFQKARGRRFAVSLLQRLPGNRPRPTKRQYDVAMEASDGSCGMLSDWTILKEHRPYWLWARFYGTT